MTEILEAKRLVQDRMDGADDFITTDSTVDIGDPRIPLVWRLTVGLLVHEFVSATFGSKLKRLDDEQMALLHMNILKLFEDKVRADWNNAELEE